MSNLEEALKELEEKIKGKNITHGPIKKLPPSYVPKPISTENIEDVKERIGLKENEKISKVAVSILNSYLIGNIGPVNNYLKSHKTAANNKLIDFIKRLEEREIKKGYKIKFVLEDGLFKEITALTPKIELHKEIDVPSMKLELTPTPENPIEDNPYKKNILPPTSPIKKSVGKLGGKKKDLKAEREKNDKIEELNNELALQENEQEKKENDIEKNYKDEIDVYKKISKKMKEKENTVSDTSDIGKLAEAINKHEEKVLEDTLKEKYGDKWEEMLEKYNTGAEALERLGEVYTLGRESKYSTINELRVKKENMKKQKQIKAKPPIEGKKQNIKSEIMPTVSSAPKTKTNIETNTTDITKSIPQGKSKKPIKETVEDKKTNKHQPKLESEDIFSHERSDNIEVPETEEKKIPKMLGDKKHETKMMAIKLARKYRDIRRSVWLKHTKDGRYVKTSSQLMDELKAQLKIIWGDKSEILKYNKDIQKTLNQCMYYPLGINIYVNRKGKNSLQYKIYDRLGRQNKKQKQLNVKLRNDVMFFSYDINKIYEIIENEANVKLSNANRENIKDLIQLEVEPYRRTQTINSKTGNIGKTYPSKQNALKLSVLNTHGIVDEIKRIKENKRSTNEYLKQINGGKNPNEAMESILTSAPKKYNPQEFNKQFTDKMVELQIKKWKKNKHGIDVDVFEIIYRKIEKYISERSGLYFELSEHGKYELKREIESAMGKSKNKTSSIMDRLNNFKA